MSTKTRTNVDMKLDALAAIHNLARTVTTGAPSKDGTTALLALGKSRHEAMDRGPERDLFAWVANSVLMSNPARDIMGGATDLDATASLVIDTMVEAMNGTR